jgi:alcohol dehydrogenase class IV
MAASDHETVFTLEATPIKFGPGAADDAGWELKRLGVKRALLVTDPGVAELGLPDRIKASIEKTVSCRSAADRASTPRRPRT